MLAQSIERRSGFFFLVWMMVSAFQALQRVMDVFVLLHALRGLSQCIRQK
jgi:hypothetical protein